MLSFPTRALCLVAQGRFFHVSVECFLGYVLNALIHWYPIPSCSDTCRRHALDCSSCQIDISAYQPLRMIVDRTLFMTQCTLGWYWSFFRDRTRRVPIGSFWASLLAFWRPSLLCPKLSWLQASASGDTVRTGVALEACLVVPLG